MRKSSAHDSSRLAVRGLFGKPFGKQLPPPPPANLQVSKKVVAVACMHVARLRRIDGTSAGAGVRIAAAAAAEAAPSARPRPRQSTNGSASSAARARADATPADLTSAIAEMDWSNEVGQTVAVKRDWWLGGTSAQRRNYHLVRVVAYSAGVVVSNRLSLTESSRILSQHCTESFTAYSRTQSTRAARVARASSVAPCAPGTVVKTRDDRRRPATRGGDDHRGARCPV